MKKGSFDFTNFDPLGRSEMKKLMAGSGDCFIMCIPCNNSYCQGYADDCSWISALQICGPGGDYTYRC